MAKRSSNIFSRAIEREQEARQNGDQPDGESNDQPKLFKPTVEPPPARVLKMPERRAADSVIDVEAVETPLEKIIEKTIEKTVTPETWNWSKPPQLEPHREIAPPETVATVETIEQHRAPEEAREAKTIADEKPFAVESEALVVTSKPALAANGNSANNRIGAPSLRHVEARPAFQTVTINAEAVEPHLVAITDPRSPHCEEFRNLRTRILHASQTQKLQAITIASGSPSEGKSTVAVNLAWLLAQTDGINALLIDADLRLPCLADYLGVSAKTGLSEVFSGEARFEDAILRLAPANLHLLPGGAARDDVAEMLSGTRFRTILEQARKQFDYIIVDAPSLGIFTDAAVLINQTDAALLVVRAGKTRYGVTNRLLETLPRERMFGVVLNGSNEGLANESHYDSYYYQNNRRRLELKEEGA